MLFRKPNIRFIAEEKKREQRKKWEKELRHFLNAAGKALLTIHRLLTYPASALGERLSLPFLQSPLGASLATYGTVALLSATLSIRSAPQQGEVVEPPSVSVRVPTYADKIRGNIEKAFEGALRGKPTLSNPSQLLSLNKRARFALDTAKVEGRDALLAIAPLSGDSLLPTFRVIKVPHFREGYGKATFRVGEYSITRPSLKVYDPIEVEKAGTTFVVVAYKANIPLDVFTEKGEEQGIFSLVISPYYSHLYHPLLAEEGLRYLLSLGKLAEGRTGTPAEEVVTILIIEHMGHRILGDAEALEEVLKAFLVGAALNAGNYKVTAGSVARGIGQFTRPAYLHVVDKAIADMAALGDSISKAECLYNNYCAALLVGHYLALLKKEHSHPLYPFLAYNGGMRRAKQVLSSPEEIDEWLRWAILRPNAGQQYETTAYFVKAIALLPLLREMVRGRSPANHPLTAEVGESYITFLGSFRYVGRASDGALVYRISPSLLSYTATLTAFLGEGAIRITDVHGNPYKGGQPYLKLYPEVLAQRATRP